MLLTTGIEREATGASGAIVAFKATATDAAGAALVPACQPSSGPTFPIGVTTVPCTGTDSHGLTGSNAFDVTVSDTTAPSPWSAGPRQGRSSQRARRR